MERRKDQKSRRSPVIHRRIISKILRSEWDQVIDLQQFFIGARERARKYRVSL
jgi:hypothetical protein